MDDHKENGKRLLTTGSRLLRSTAGFGLPDRKQNNEEEEEL